MAFETYMFGSRLVIDLGGSSSSANVFVRKLPLLILWNASTALFEAIVCSGVFSFVTMSDFVIASEIPDITIIKILFS